MTIVFEFCIVGSCRKLGLGFFIFQVGIQLFYWGPKFIPQVLNYFIVSQDSSFKYTQHSTNFLGARINALVTQLFYWSPGFIPQVLNYFIES